MIDLPQSATALDSRIAKLLRPSDGLGTLYVSFASSTSLAALWLSLSEFNAIWLLGQLVWAISFLQWFSILHEAGHKTSSRRPLPIECLDTWRVGWPSSRFSHGS
jgi:fatty acid desaturase